jgi:hypothetical protein
MNTFLASTMANPPLNVDVNKQASFNSRNIEAQCPLVGCSKRRIGRINIKSLQP